MRGTKKSIEALEIFFETGKKPNQEQFFDMLASFYHKDEDISFLISIAKATLTDAQTGEDNSRFMTALRVYQSILWWVRLGKLPLLNFDVQELITDNINDFYNNVLMKVDDPDDEINTLGEVILAFQDFKEQTGGIKSLRDRIIDLELVLHEVPKNLRQVQNTFDSLQNQVTTAQNKADDAWTRANNAQTSANNAQNKADDAWTRANNAQSSANNAQNKADDAWNRANNAQNTANSADTRSSNNYGRIATIQDHIDNWVNVNINSLIGSVFGLQQDLGNLQGYAYGYLADAALDATISRNVLIPGLQDFANHLLGRIQTLESYHL